jgi:hypothetical protein
MLATNGHGCGAKNILGKNRSTTAFWRDGDEENIISLFLFDFSAGSGETDPCNWIDGK